MNKNEQKNNKEGLEWKLAFEKVDFSNVYSSNELVKTVLSLYSHKEVSFRHCAGKNEPIYDLYVRGDPKAKDYYPDLSGFSYHTVTESGHGYVRGVALCTYDAIHGESSKRVYNEIRAIREPTKEFGEYAIFISKKRYEPSSE